MAVQCDCHWSGVTLLFGTMNLMDTYSKSTLGPPKKRIKIVLEKMVGLFKKNNIKLEQKIKKLFKNYNCSNRKPDTKIVRIMGVKLGGVKGTFPQGALHRGAEKNMEGKSFCVAF